MEVSVKYKETPLTIIFRHVPEPIVENLGEILINNEDARKALTLFLQDSGLLPAEKKITLDITDIQIK